LEIRSCQGRWRSVAATGSLEVQARGAREERERRCARWGEGEWMWGFRVSADFILCDHDYSRWIENEWSEIIGPSRPSYKQPVPNNFLFFSFYCTIVK
jgi:hypothetical protein